MHRFVLNTSSHSTRYLRRLDGGLVKLADRIVDVVRVTKDPTAAMRQNFAQDEGGDPVLTSKSHA